MQILDNEHGDQCCPNLDIQSVLRGAHEGLHLEVLLERLEEDLDLPAVLVDGGNSGGRQREVVGQENELFVMSFIPYNHSAEDMRALLPCPDAGKSNMLICEEVAIDRDFLFSHDLVDGIVLHPCDEVDTCPCPGGEQGVVVVPLVHGDNGAFRERHLAGNSDVMPLSVGDVRIGGKIPVMVQQEMKLDRTLGSPELSPGEHAQAERYGGAVQGEKLVLESELSLLARHGSTVSVQQMVKEVPIHLPRPVGIGIGKGGLPGKVNKSQVSDLAYAAGKASADLPDALGLSQLAEQHGYEVCPGAIPLRMPFGIVVENKLVEGHSINKG